MDVEQLKKEYEEFNPYYISLQKEIFSLVSDLVEKNKEVIDVADFRQRPFNEIKSLESILVNVKNPDKYVDHKSILDIKDIAGVRITCHCEDDVENIAVTLEGEIKQKDDYINVIREDKGGDRNSGKSTPPYRAVHINFLKKIKKDYKVFQISGEIQIRTVMADAWAVQDRKYIYGKESEGDAQELTTAVSEIMKGCEKLWSLVKNKSSLKDNNVIKDLEAIKEKTLAVSRKPIILDKNRNLLKWFNRNKQVATEGLYKLNLNTFLEVIVIPPDIGLDFDKAQLREKARGSTIRTFGWPIGIFFENRPEFSPKVDTDGIHAEISIKESDWIEKGKERVVYDYWSINANGAFYLKKSLFENERRPDSIFFNTRIVRITEILLYISNLYTALDVPVNAKILISINHEGLKDKKLDSSSPNRFIPQGYIIETNKVETTVETTLLEIDSNLDDVVEKFTKPLFEQFNFFNLDKKVLKDIVNNFRNGKVV